MLCWTDLTDVSQVCSILLRYVSVLAFKRNCASVRGGGASVDNREKNLLSSSVSSTCPHSMVNFGPLAAEIGLVVWCTPPNFNGFHILVVLLHGTPVVGVSQTLRRLTEGATYIRQGGRHVGHGPTFLFFFLSSFFPHLISAVADWMSTILPHMVWP